jgi:proton-translocating NADH-quinone oxidoreductase chain N
MSLAESTLFFAPEIVLVVFALVVLGLDLVVKGREARQGELALVGLIVSLVASIALTGRQGALFFGMFTLDPFTQFFRIVAGLTAIFILLMSLGYVRKMTSFKGEFYSLVLFSTLAMILMAGATDLIMVILSIEFLSITSYVLTGYLRGNARSNEAAVKYFLYGAVTTAAMFYGASLLYGVTGTTNLLEIARFFGDREAMLQTNLGGLALPIAVFLLAGFGFKIAFVPFHQWSPDAYEGAPTPVTAFLSVGPKSAGLAILIRVFVTALPTFQVDWVAVLVGVSIITMTLGNVVAISQGNIKRMLAYSSIAQAGYMLIGVVSLGVAGAQAVQPIGSTLIYIFAYLFTNLGAFTAVVALDEVAGTDRIEDYAGLIRRAPFMAVALVIFFLSLAGIPPTAGFIGKFYVFSAAIQTASQANQGMLYALAVIGVINGVISIVYYFNVVRQMFFMPARESAPLRIPGSLQAALVLTLVMTLVIGLYPQPFVDLANQSVQMVTR